MKLSELSNDQAADILIRLSGPVGAICDDEEAVQMIDEYKKRYKMPLFYAVGKMIPTVVGREKSGWRGNERRRDRQDPPGFLR